MLRIGVTGQRGFIGSHLYNTLGLYPDTYERINFSRDFFTIEKELDNFVSQCDVIVHLAALNRHEDEELIYNTNVTLVEKLISSLNRTRCKPHIIISSSTQESRDNLYGKSKKKCRHLLEKWAKESNAIITGLLIPNVFGPFGKPNYNSVVATFCHKVVNCEEPKIDTDATLNLIYVQELVTQILSCIDSKLNTPKHLVAHTSRYKVSEILEFILNYKNTYQTRGEIPTLANTFELHLFNTYRCYMDVENHFPVCYEKHTDDRGSFVEVIRLGIGGQVSFSTTVPNVTRGNHFHTRKIERFSVIKGKALIQLRKIGTDKVLDFYLDGDTPSYVDMPIWYTHNIRNIGDEILYTNFWINEPYNPDDADTYFEKV